MKDRAAGRPGNHDLVDADTDWLNARMPAMRMRAQRMDLNPSMGRAMRSAIHFCLASSMALLAICHSLIEQPATQSPSERERRWKKLASDAKTAGRAAYRAALVLSDPAANESLGGQGAVIAGRSTDSKA
jgi:hypothetical protein